MAWEHGCVAMVTLGSIEKMARKTGKQLKISTSVASYDHANTEQVYRSLPGWLLPGCGQCSCVSRWTRELCRPVGRIHNLLRTGNYVWRVGAGAPVYLAALMEYLVWSFMPDRSKERGQTKSDAACVLYSCSLYFFVFLHCLFRSLSAFLCAFPCLAWYHNRSIITYRWLARLHWLSMGVNLKH